MRSPELEQLCAALRTGALDLSLDNAYLVAGVASALIAWRTHNLLLTIVLGMAIFLGWRVLW